ncbi:MAG: UDP-N-acetylglucosamine 2-epimerase (non-hydrolyzing) [Deltaproteobacteria bacterium]|nr:UDP-N-acetylglucosamine 2-epimerase (non-hydrolyzing) [Deltaproteobacteria bacterium]
MKVLTIVGARPQFIKAAAVCRAVRARHTELLVHTGQHHDHDMSRVFFDQLGIPEPDLNLGIAGGPHGQMTGRMLEALETVIVRERPDWVLVYGDTNSTLAGALAAAKLHVAVAHVEAGLRSFNRRMPEELNRVVTDHVSTLLLCPTRNAVSLLEREGITRGVHNVGDVMFDSVLSNRARAAEVVDRRALLAGAGIDPGSQYSLATLHRPENTDDASRLGEVLAALSRLGLPVLLPLHPRTRKVLEATESLRSRLGPSIRIVAPLGYLELLAVAGDARVILTDSGGLQKEAFFLGVRCVTLRDETEWIETVELGANEVVGANAERIVLAAQRAVALGPLGPEVTRAGPFGDGRAAERIVAALESS